MWSVGVTMGQGFMTGIIITLLLAEAFYTQQGLFEGRNQVFSRHTRVEFPHFLRVCSDERGRLYGINSRRLNASV